MSSLQELIQDFVDELSATIESQAITRARKAVESALGGRAAAFQFGRVGRLRAGLTHANGSNGTSNGTNGELTRRKPRKKPPIQLCPVPGCKERAAPVFGMVCAKHKGISKTKIRKYREARRAKKTGGGKAVKVAARRSPSKPARKARKPAARKPAAVRARAAKPRAAKSQAAKSQAAKLLAARAQAAAPSAPAPAA